MLRILAAGLLCFFGFCSVSWSQAIVNHGRIGNMGDGNLVGNVQVGNGMNSRFGTAGSGMVREQSRSLPMFQAVASDSLVDTVVRTNSRLTRPKVVVRADHNFIPLIITTVKEGTFYASLKSSRGVFNVTALSVIVEVPVLQSVELKGSADISLEQVDADTLTLRHCGAGSLKGGVNAKQLTIDHAGSGDINLSSIKAETLALRANGPGTVRGSGYAKKLVIDYAANGNVVFQDLMAVDCDVSSKGNGNIKVRVSGNLDAKNNGLGNIVYYGSPIKVETKNDGLGRIKQGKEEWTKGDEVVVLANAKLMVGKNPVVDVQKGDRLTIENPQGKWLWVRKGQTLGWIASEKVEPSDD